ncbi:MAG: hypothetical protein ABSD21_11210 [Rhizomicrobium sp.]|jgi:hypothetical protein
MTGAHINNAFINGLTADHITTRSLTADSIDGEAVMAAPIYFSEDFAAGSDNSHQLNENVTGYFFYSPGGFDSNDIYWPGSIFYGRTVEVNIDGTVQRQGGATGKFELWLENSTGGGFATLGSVKAFDLDGALACPFSFTRIFRSNAAGGRIKFACRNTNGWMQLRQATINVKIYNAY